MIFLKLALKSIQNRRVSTLLTLFSIALSVCLLLTVEKIKRSAEEGFTQTISQTDLIVGARSGPMNLLLYTVFNIGSATNNISWKTYEEIKKHPAVEWTIPYSLGDGHRGYRVVGTTQDFFDHYHFRGDKQPEFQEGKGLADLWDVVLGAEVARVYKYKLNDPIVVSHGVTKTEGILHHDDKPFRIKGILKPTGTALDRAVYVSLEGLEALHMDWKDGAVPTPEQQIKPEQIKKEDLKVQSITAFFLRTKSRIETLRLQRELNNYKEEPLLAIIPGVALSELWKGLSYAEQAFRIISWVVVVIGLVAMLIALLTSLNERRREMAILRSLGAGTNHIVMLLVLESTLITFFGALAGFGFYLSGLLVLENWLIKEFGIYVNALDVRGMDLIYIGATLVAGVLVGFIPALQARLSSLKDGLSVRV
ncbi:MAG: peptide ABC transporter permease [Oligoflexia bacterium]|nr:MAG: peptide ABC transporter permease [Oligoflexia bacterium]